MRGSNVAVGTADATGVSNAAAEQTLVRVPFNVADATPVPLLETPVHGVRDSVRRRMLALADMLTLLLAYGVVWLVAPPGQSILHKAPLLAALPLWVVLNKLLGLYDRDANLLNKSTLDELPRLAQSIFLGAAGVFLLAPLFPGVHVGRAQNIVFIGAALLLNPPLRSAVRAIVTRRFDPERCLIVGSGLVAGTIAHKLAQHPEYGVELVGFVDEQWDGDASPTATGRPMKLLGELDDFEYVCTTFGIERVIIAFSSLSHEHLLDVIRASKQLNLKITVVPRLFDAIGHAVEVDQLEGMTLLGLRGLSRTHSSLMLKRLIDLTGALCGLLVLSPILAAVAIVIKLSSPGPVFFRQRRIGRDNEPFEIFKFRTMVQDADKLKSTLTHLNEASGPMFKISEDPRVTRVGRFLRRTSLDELPQLWNVVRGEMSLVGPRPLIPHESDAVIGWHRARLALTPGLTGPWQVLGRTAIPFSEMIRLDYLYVAEWSLWNDIKLLIRTAPEILRARGH